MTSSRPCVNGAEWAAFDAHAAWLRKLLAGGLLIAASPCLGLVSTGIAIFGAASESAAIERNAAAYAGLSRLHRRGEA